MKIKWEKIGDEMVPMVGTTRVAWAAQPGSQEAFLSCPVPEALLEGNRGGGKTDALLMDFGQHVGQGYGIEWRGILFRKTYKQLNDVIEKSKKWFPRIWPTCTFNSSDMYWQWPTGEKLFFRYMERESDYWNYHGHNYPWIAWEELTTWADDRCYRKMMSCWRSPTPGIPKKLRSTTNPYGPGHNWVKHRFRLPVYSGHTVGPVIREEGLPDRVAVHSHLDENVVLMTADPNYKQNIAASARSPAELAAWLEGSWDIVAGGMFDDLWNPNVHVVPDFLPPPNWNLDRAFDWGSSKPFSVGWWAESDGSDVLVNGHYYSTVRGDLFRVREWYGTTGEPNEGLRMLATDITKGIIQRELNWGVYGQVKAGPADNAIFNVENGGSIAGDMMRSCRVDGKTYRGIQWTRADKRPGSRKNGWELIRHRLAQSISPEGSVREKPGLYVCRSCNDFIRTVPVLPRDLEHDPDDVDTDAEDHIADEMRYRVRSGTKRVKSSRASGVAS